MKTYIVKRLLISLVLLLGISIIAFFIVRLIPGDTITVMLGSRYNEEQAMRLRENYGLDRSLTVQYGLWIKNVLSGDLGNSFFTKKPVLETIAERLVVTGQLAGWALTFALVFGLTGGVLAAVNRNGPIDQGVSFLSMLGISVPNFWLGTMMILVFSLGFQWFPSGGYQPISQGLTVHLKSMVMPAVALGFAVSAVIMRSARSAMLEVLNKEYMDLAKMKGVSPGKMIFLHALKNALIPIITVVGIQAGYLLGGSVVIEQVFNLPGVGRLVFEAINNRDYVLLQGVILFIASAFVVINMVVDLLYALINPRITYS